MFMLIVTIQTADLAWMIQTTQQYIHFLAANWRWEQKWGLIESESGGFSSTICGSHISIWGLVLWDALNRWDKTMMMKCTMGLPYEYDIISSLIVRVGTCVMEIDNSYFFT